MCVSVHHIKRRPEKERERERKREREKEREREREREIVGEMTGFGCDLLSYALVIM